MLRFLFFSIFFLPFSYGKQWRMMLIYGKISGTTGFLDYTMSKPMEECYTLCYNTDNCAVSYYYGVTCKLFKFGNFSISQLNSSSEMVVGIKRHLPDDQCPDLSIPYYTSTDTWKGAQDVSANLNKIFKNGTQWSIHYSYLACDIRTQLFRRGNYWVCVGARAFDGCAVYEKAEELCGDTGMSLTAPYNFDEWQYFNASKGTYPGYITALWADGRYGTYTDSTLIGNTFPTTKNNSMCPYIAFTSTVKMRHCDTAKETSICLHGAACLMKTFKIN